MSTAGLRQRIAAIVTIVGVTIAVSSACDSEDGEPPGSVTPSGSDGAGTLPMPQATATPNPDAGRDGAPAPTGEPMTSQP